MSVESVSRFTQPAVTQLLRDTERVVYTIVPDLLRNPETNRPGMYPHIVAVTPGPFGSYLALDVNPLTSANPPKILPTKVYGVDDDKKDGEDSDDECSQKDDSDDDKCDSAQADPGRVEKAKHHRCPANLKQHDVIGNEERAWREIGKKLLGNKVLVGHILTDGDGHFAKGRTKHLRDYVHIGRSAAKAVCPKLPKILPTKVYAVDEDKMDDEDSDNECSQKDNSDDDSQTSDEETSTDFPKRVKDE
ncbi:lens induction in camera-type eye [Branchiostoma belcheri]|nr:lens induction in camera-type eye [Branchiostoma belcheri]